MILKLTSQNGKTQKLLTDDANAIALLGRLNGNAKWIEVGEGEKKFFVNIEGFVKIEIIPEIEKNPEPEPE